jgi:hypothetical protein
LHLTIMIFAETRKSANFYHDRENHRLEAFVLMNF